MTKFVLFVSFVFVNDINCNVFGDVGGDRFPFLFFLVVAVVSGEDLLVVDFF